MSVGIESVVEVPCALSSEVKEPARFGGLSSSDVADASEKSDFGEVLGEVAADAKPVIADTVTWDSVARCKSSRCFRSFR